MRPCHHLKGTFFSVCVGILSFFLPFSRELSFRPGCSLLQERWLHSLTVRISCYKNCEIMKISKVENEVKCVQGTARDNRVSFLYICLRYVQIFFLDFFFTSSWCYFLSLWKNIPRNVSVEVNRAVEPSNVFDVYEVVHFFLPYLLTATVPFYMVLFTRVSSGMLCLLLRTSTRYCCKAPQKLESLHKTTVWEIKLHWYRISCGKRTLVSFSNL